MKKKLFVILIIFILCGCQKYNDNLLCALDNNKQGYNTRIEFKFNKDKIEKSKLTITFNKKEDALESCKIVSLYKIPNVKVQCSNNEVIIDGYQYIDLDSESNVYKKNNMISNLIKQGYYCK